VGVQQREARQQRAAAQLVHHAGEVARHEAAGTLAVRAGQQVERERQQLPGEQEDERLVGADHGRHREEQEAVERQHDPPRRVLQVHERNASPAPPASARKIPARPSTRKAASPKPSQEPRPMRACVKPAAVVKPTTRNAPEAMHAASADSVRLTPGAAIAAATRPRSLGQ
jgi:hypothetical protein